MLNPALDLTGFDNNFLAFIRVVPEAGSLLHGVQPLQLVAHTLQIQGIRQPLQRRTAVVQLLLICVKFNVHSKISHFLWDIGNYRKKAADQT